MVIKEFYRTREDGVGLYKSYSDNGVYIRKIGTDEEYSEAIDVENSWFVYEETDRPIEQEEVLPIEQEEVLPIEQEEVLPIEQEEVLYRNQEQYG